MRRGEIWTVSGGPDYSSKPRPSLILQDEIFETAESVTVCGLTSDTTRSELLRIRVEPTSENGLLVASSIMIDKITTISRKKIGRRLGVLSQAEMIAVSQAIIVFLSLVSGPREER